MPFQKQEAVFFRGFYVEVISRIVAYLKKTLKNPKWFLMSFAGRFVFFRSIAVAFAKHVDLQEYQSSTQFSNFVELNPKLVAATLKQNGLCTGISLPKPLFKDILDFAYSEPCYGNLDPQLGFLYREKERCEKKSGPFFTAQYFNTIKLCPAIQALANDPKLLEVAAHYLGAKPICTGSRLWWNFVVDNDVPYDSNKVITFFHYDLDDYACLRFFFYLTDVGEEGGAHVVVQGSHMRKSFSHVLLPVKRRSDENILAYYGPENVIMVSGSAGSGFAEDTFCYHKATRPLQRDRLMLQIQFAIHDYGLHNDLIDPCRFARID